MYSSIVIAKELGGAGCDWMSDGREKKKVF